MRADRSIIVGADGSDASLLAVHWTAVLASRTHMKLRIIHALPTFEMYAGIPEVVAGPSMTKEFQQRSDEILEKAVAHARSVDMSLDIESECTDSEFSDFVIDASRTAEMIVLGSHGYGRVKEALLGSSIIRIAQRSHCPVAIRKPVLVSEKPAAGPVVVGVDTGQDQNEVLTAAFKLASALDRPLTAVHAWTLLPGSGFDYAIAEYNSSEDNRRRRAWLDEQIFPFGMKFPNVDVVSSTVMGSPAHELSLIAEAVQAESVVVGSRGRGALAGTFLGSTSQNLIHHAPCSVLVVR